MGLRRRDFDAPRRPLHQGPKPWPWKPCFASVLAVDDRHLEALGSTVLGFDFILDDLGRQNDEQILARAIDAAVRLILVALRNSRGRPRLMEHLARVMKALQSELRGPAAVAALAHLARYVFDVDDTPTQVIGEIFSNALAPEIRSSVMSTADMLRAEGRVEGRVEGRRESLLELLRVKFGAIDPAIRSRVETASPDQVFAWLHRVVVVGTVREVFDA